MYILTDGKNYVMDDPIHPGRVMYSTSPVNAKKFTFKQARALLNNKSKKLSWIRSFNMVDDSSGEKIAEQEVRSRSNKGVFVGKNDIDFDISILDQIMQETNNLLGIAGWNMAQLTTYQNMLSTAWDTFNKINESIKDSDKKYKHPRNLVSGSLLLLDSKEAAQRNMRFIAWRVIKGFEHKFVYEDLLNAEKCGFERVPMIPYIGCENTQTVLDTIKDVADANNIPYDGAVMTYDDYDYGESLGKTDKFFRHSIAYKYEDQLYETVLKDIEWNTSKTGLINPVAIFEPIDLDGAITTRATLHNISYIKKLSLGIGDRIRVYRSNKVIPKVHDSIDKSNNFTIPDKCPICGGETKIVKENDSEVLMCMNDDCQGKLLGQLSNAVSRNALNVDNLSEATLEKFISLGWLNSIKSIYHLSDYKGKMYSLEGFGKKSVDKLLESIEKSRETTLDRFIYALSVPMIGKSASKDIAKHFKYNFDEFYHCFSCGYGYFWNLKVDGIGVVASNNIQKFAITYMDKVFELSKEFTFKIPSESNNTQNTLQGKTFVITGSLEKYSNRDELKSIIESYGGKVSGSVSAKTFALINNDIESSSSKNKKAKSLGVQIINEEQFMQLIGE